MRGHGLLSRSVTIYFRADCSHALRGRNLGVIYVNNPQVRGFFRLEKTGLGGFLVVFTVGDINEPGARYVADIVTDELAVQMVRDAVGEPDLEVAHRGRRQVARGGRRRRHLPGRAGSSWPATPPTPCRRPVASAATPASRTPTTWPGSSRSSSRGQADPVPARHLRRRASARRCAGRRAGLQPLRAALRSRPRHWRACTRPSPTCTSSSTATGRGPCCPMPTTSTTAPRHQPPPVLRPSRHPGAPRRAATRRRGHLHPRPVRGRLRPADRSRRRRVARPAQRAAAAGLDLATYVVAARPPASGRTGGRRGELLHDRLRHRSLRRRAGPAGRLRRLAPASLGSRPRPTAHSCPRARCCAASIDAPGERAGVLAEGS